VHSSTSNDHHPRVVEVGSDDPVGSLFQRSPLFLATAKTRVVEPLTSSAEVDLESDSQEYKPRLADPLETHECQAQHVWQLTSFPTCNVFHEMDIPRLAANGDRPSNAMIGNKGESVGLTYLNNGYWRDVWSMKHIDNTIVLKTMRFMHNVTHRNFDRNQKDAMVTEHFTRSPWILDGYGFCGNSALTEYADGGDISKAIWHKVPIPSNNRDYVNPTRKFRIRIKNMTRREQFILSKEGKMRS